MKLKILLMLIVASAICIVVNSEPYGSKRSKGGALSGNPLGIIKAELIEEDAPTAMGSSLVSDMDMTDQAEAESAQRIVIKPVRRHRGKRIRIRLVGKKPKNYVRLKVSGTKNVEQKYPGEEGGDENNDYDGAATDEEGNETANQNYPDANDDESTQASEDTQNGEDAMKVKHHHHHHHHNHVKTVVKKVPEPYPVEKIVHVPVEKIVHVPKPYPVEKVVEKVVHVPVEKVVEKLVHIPKPYPVEKIVHVPKIVEKIVYSPLFGKDGKMPSSTTSYSGPHNSHFADLTSDSKLKFGASSGSSSNLDIIYPGGHTSSLSNSGKFKHPKFPDFEDINKQSNKVHSILDNDAFDFGDVHTSKPKDHHHNGDKKNGNKKNKGRNKKKKNNNGNGSSNGLFGDDHYSPSSSANSHSYSGVSMPSYTHEFSVSNSDQKEVFFNPSSGSSSAHHHQHHPHHHQAAVSPHSHHPHYPFHYESLPFKYPAPAVTESESEIYGQSASDPNPDYSQYNWTPSVNDFGSTSSAFSLPTQYNHVSSSLAGAESAQVQSPIGPVFRPPRKNPPVPFHGKKGGSQRAPRAGPRRPTRNNQGESSHRGSSSSSSSLSSTSSKMAGHHHFDRMAAASNNKAYVHQSRPRPITAAASELNYQTVMLPPPASVQKEHVSEHKATKE